MFNWIVQRFGARLERSMIARFQGGGVTLQAHQVAPVVNRTIDKYRSELAGPRWLVTRPAMALAALNDLSAYLTEVSMQRVTAFAYALFAVKAAVEIPAVWRFLIKSRDWVGVLAWLAMKPVNYLLPVIGALLEMGLLEFIVRRRVRIEALQSCKALNAADQTDLTIPSTVPGEGQPQRPRP